MAFNYKNYQFSKGEHRDNKVIFIYFPLNTLWKNELKVKFPSTKFIYAKVSNRQLGNVKSPLDDL